MEEELEGFYNPFADTDAADLGIFGSSNDHNEHDAEDNSDTRGDATQVTSPEAHHDVESQAQEWRKQRPLPLAQSTATFSEYFLVDELDKESSSPETLSAEEPSSDVEPSSHHVETTGGSNEAKDDAEIRLERLLESHQDLKYQNNILREEISRLRDEKRKFETELVLLNVLDPHHTVQALSEGRPYNLEQYKSVFHKKLLLEEACYNMNSEVIALVTLFVRNSLNANMFVKVLNAPGCEAAKNFYIHYLRKNGYYDRLVTVFQLSGMKNEEALMRLYIAYHLPNADVRANALRDCVRWLEVNRASTFGFYIEQVREQLQLYARQRPVELFDKQRARARDPIYVKFPRNCILHKSLYTTLLYLLFYHPNAAEGKLSCPADLKRQFKVSEKRYLWASLKARALIGDWNSVKALTQTRGFFGSNVKSAIGFLPFVEVTVQSNGPPALVEYFCEQISPPEEKFRVAMKYRLYKCAYETVIQQRVRPWAVRLMNALSGQERHFKIRKQLEGALSGNTVKWRDSVSRFDSLLSGLGF